MALVKFGAGITQLAGSIAGNTFARNRFGNYVRSRTKPVNPTSARQVTARAAVAFFAERWHHDLTDVQRGLWDTYAAAIAMKNKLGETIHLTGFNHYARLNCSYRVWSPNWEDNAPTILSLAEQDGTLVCSEEDIAGQTFTFTFDNTGWAANGDNKVRMLIYQGQPQLASRTFFGGPWRFIDVVDPIEGAAGTSTHPAGFSFALGQKVWFQARILTAMGRLSNLWTVAPRTIIADP